MAARNGDPVAEERLLDEVRDHHPVAARLARPDGVEQPHHRHRELLFLVIGKAEELVDRFGGGFAVGHGVDHVERPGVEIAAGEDALVRGAATVTELGSVSCLTGRRRVVLPL